MSCSGTVVLGAIDMPSGLFETFGIHWQLLLIQTLNFLSVVTILYFFAFKPILKTMEERRSKIENGLKYAEKMRLELAHSGEVIQKHLLSAKEEAYQIVEEAKHQSTIYAEQQKVETERLTENMIAKAKQDIADEKAEMLLDLKQEVKTVVVDVAAKVLARELSMEERKQYLEKTEKHL